MILPGHVIRILDTGISRSKPKRHICISFENGLFLRINSRPLWTPCHTLRLAKNADYLDHESYAELRQLCRFSAAELSEALRHPDNPLGRMTSGEAADLALSAQRAETLSEEHRALIWENLVERWG